MTTRDKIMDKYWLEFLRKIEGDASPWKAGINTCFWEWFYNEIMRKGGSWKLEDYL